MEIVGKPVCRAVCRNCGGPITFTRWQDGVDSWSHDDQPYGPFCPGQYVAEPLNGSAKDY